MLSKYFGGNFGVHLVVIVLSNYAFICVDVLVGGGGDGGGGYNCHYKYRYTCIAFIHIL
jgi:hypothetical protein